MAWNAGYRLAAVSTVAAALVLSTCAVDTARARDLDLATLLGGARAALEEDLARWSECSFERRVRRERLDKDGIVVWRRAYRFDVLASPDGFEELLRQIDGREPTRRQAEEHRRAGRFEKHYRAAVAARIRNPIGEDLPLQPLLFNQEHRYRGREKVDGIPCHRLSFEERPPPLGAPVSAQLEHAARGTFCVSIDGSHMVEAEVESRRMVVGGPLRLDHFSLRVESRPAAGAWLPRLFETRSDIKVAFHVQRKRNRYEYSRYRCAVVE